MTEKRTKTVVNLVLNIFLNQIFAGRTRNQKKSVDIEVFDVKISSNQVH